MRIKKGNHYQHTEKHPTERKKYKKPREIVIIKSIDRG
ncbi:hypothetical protein N0824_03210 [Microcystis sp. 0824]|nr:hypothetical protein N0824_03210 [Microcystis sp. 0824]